MAIKCKQISTDSVDRDRISNCFDLFNGCVAPGDTITVKIENEDRVKILVDFEMGVDVTETEATNSVTDMVSKAFTYKR